MAGTLVVTTDTALRDVNQRIVGRRIKITGTADSSDGSFPDLTLKKLNGYIQPIITNPGSTAPTDNYDIALLHPSDSTANMATALTDRDTSTTEVAVATLSGSATPIYANGDYILRASGNSVNSATLVLIMEILFLTA